MFRLYLSLARRVIQNSPDGVALYPSLLKMSSLALLIFILPVLAFAQTSCGDFIDTFDGIDERTPIEDCDDPFGLNTVSEVRDLAYTLNGEVLAHGEVREVDSLPISIYLDSSESISGYNYNSFSLYKHEGNDYRLVDVAYTTSPTTVILDVNATGTYSIATTFNMLVGYVNNNKSLWQKILSRVVPTAHAQGLPGKVKGLVTFTIVEPSSLTGASNILFLPGIQASRLYKDGVLGTEDQIWEPNINGDVKQLAMTEDGLSINDIYTKDVIDEVFGVSNIYKSLLAQFEDMKEEGLIDDYLPFAYDWRYNVQDIAYGGAKHANDFVVLVDELKSLADSSYTGKVTIIGHSNGGLLAKALVTELTRLSLDHLVDKVIFVATPHLGTPKAIATILHGYDQQRLGGAIIDDKTVRTVIKNMPGVYSLLPSAKYLEIFGGPLITFGEGEVTEDYLNTYGDSIDTFVEYVDFLNGEEGRTSEPDNVSEPSIANTGMLDWALSDHKNKLDNWSAPSGIEVHNIVGVGLKTVKSLEYRELQEHITCSSNIFGQITCDEPVYFIRPYAHFTTYGDETVTSLSAESVVGQTYYFDLNKYNRDLLNIFIDYTHVDIMEIVEVRDIITNIINSTTTAIDYVTSELPEYDIEYRVLSVDSPVRMVVEDNEGNITGVIVKSDGTREVLKEISSSEYLEFAGTKYLIVPKVIDTVTTLYGEAYGGFTLTRATLDSDDVQVVDTVMINATTTPNMIARFATENEKDGNLEVDIDGDGEIDYQTDLRGSVIPTEIDEITFSILREQIENLNLKHSRERLLLTILSVAERAYERSDRHRVYIRIANRSLENLGQLIKRYERLKWLSKEESSALKESIKQLRANIK
ncbi:MAG: hypothetical protein R3B53_01425 [Candidatus Paceibacterota bacterium]